MVTRIYSAIECFMFRDGRFLKLDYRTKLTWLYLLGNSSRVNIPGLVECGYVDLTKFLDYPLKVNDRERFGAALKETKKNVKKLVDLEWVLYDQNAEIFYLTQAIKRNLPDNSAMIIGWLKKLRERPSSPLLRRWLSDASKVIRKAFGNQDARFTLIQTACRTVAAGGALNVVNMEISKGFYDGYPRGYIDGMDRALAKVLDDFNSKRNKERKREKARRQAPVLELPLGDERGKPKPDTLPDGFNERQQQLWELFKTEKFYIPGQGDMTVIDAVSDPKTLCKKLGGEGFKHVSLDLVYTLAAWSYSNKRKARKNLGAFLTACFSKQQVEGAENARIDLELAATNKRIQTFDATDIPVEPTDNDQSDRIAAMKRAGFEVDE
jgi:hypothetical protein